MTKQPPGHPFVIADLPTLGLTYDDLLEMITNAVVRRVFRGAYVPDGVTDTVEMRAGLASRLLAPGHVISGRTAAWIYGIDTYAWGELGECPRVDACVLPGSEPSSREGIDGHTRDLAPSDICEVNGMAVTTPLRTALDLGCMLRAREALAVLDAFAREHGVSAAELTPELPRFKRRRGVRQLRALVPLVDGRAESPRESWTRYEIIVAGLPPPDLQYWVDVDGVPTYRLDLAYPHRRVAVEYDGYEAHERTPEQRARDRERRDWLRGHGWTVIVIRRGGFTGSELARWLGQVRAALGTPPYTPLRRLERGSVRG